MRASSPLLSLVGILLFVGSGLTAQNTMRLGKPRAGAIPGTEGWIALLRGRSFALHDRLAEIRATQNRESRCRLLDALATTDATTSRDSPTGSQGLVGA
jgi:hypothetical protein